MTILDLILLAVLALFVMYGLRLGFVHMVGSFIGLIAGVYLASRWYPGFATWFAAAFHLNPLIAGVVAFGVFVTILNRLIGLVFTIFDRVFNFVKLVPGIGAVDRLGGAALGFLEGALTIGITVFFATKIDVSPAWQQTLSSSTLVPIFLTISSLVTPLLPSAIRSAASVLLP